MSNGTNIEIQQEFILCSECAELYRVSYVSKTFEIVEELKKPDSRLLNGDVRGVMKYWR